MQFLLDSKCCYLTVLGSEKCSSCWLLVEIQVLVELVHTLDILVAFDKVQDRGVHVVVGGVKDLEFIEIKGFDFLAELNLVCKNNNE